MGTTIPFTLQLYKHYKNHKVFQLELLTTVNVCRTFLLKPIIVGRFKIKTYYQVNIKDREEETEKKKHCEFSHFDF